MKRRIILAVLMMFGLSVAVVAGGAEARAVDSESGSGIWSVDLTDQQYNSYLDWLGKFGSNYATENGGIDSVRWMAATKAKYPDNNVCSLWIGPRGDKFATTIELTEGSNMVQKEDGVVLYGLSFYGMCTNDNVNQAVNVSVRDSNREAVAPFISGTPPTVVPRNKYTSGASETPDLWIDVGKFKEAAEKSGGVTRSATETTYKYIVDVYRCHAVSSTSNASNGNCSHMLTPIVLKVKAEYYAVSNVGDNLGGYASTEIKNVSTKAQIAATRVAVDQSVHLRFSHNIYSSTSKENVSWSYNRSASLNGGSGYKINRTYSAVGTSPANLTVLNNSYYAATDRPGSDGRYNYIWREEYELVFTEPNKTVEFCESVTVQGITTTACTTYTSGGTIPGACNEWAPTSYTNSRPSGSYGTGETSVLSKVSNGRNDGGSAGWKGEVNGNGLTYAKPGDTVKWTNCYYPGVQYYANTGILSLTNAGNYVGTHAQENVCSNTRNTYVNFQTVINWNNLFSIKTDSPFGFNNANVLITNAAKTYNSGNLTNGDAEIKSVSNNYAVKNTNVGTGYGEFYDKISTTATPFWVHTWNNGRHPWQVVCCSSSECGTHCCGYHCSSECCNSCTVTRQHTNDEVVGEYKVNPGGIDSEAQVKVPYNFINETKVTLSSSNGGIVYAGETATVGNTQAETMTRLNSTVSSAKYATISRNAQVKLMAYTARADDSGSSPRLTNGAGANLCSSLPYADGQCDTIGNTGTITLNPSGNLSGAVNGNLTSSLNGAAFNGLYNVYDATAGYWFCVVLAVYPHTSGEDTNMDAKGDDTWYISQPSCKQVAKRPAFQIWGGTLYSEQGIKTATMSKTNIAGAYPYCRSGSTSELCIARNGLHNANTTVFGSWGEQGVISNGIVTLFSSGAGTGLTPGVGIGSGSLEGGNTNYCNNRTALSFANYGTNQLLGITVCPFSPMATGSAGVASRVVNRASLVSYWVPEEIKTGEVSGTIALSDSYLTPTASATGRNIRYGYSSGGLTISGGALWLNTTYVVRAGGTVTINGNITYPLSEAMSSTGAIPKAVIYAGGDINISCSVGEVDAVLIAEGVVNTCYDAGDVNAPNRSLAQLTIRGAVIANSLELPRTYGAAKGSASGVAAEVIDYDTSAILWGRYMAGAAESDTLTVTYQHELAPRY